MKVIRKKQIGFYGIAFIAFFILSSFIDNRGDDFVFKKGIQEFGSIWGWMRWFGANWGGRIIPQGILVVLLQFPDIIFHIINALSWVSLIIYIKRCFDPNEALRMPVLIILLPAVILFLLPSGCLNASIFWKCACVLYLWGGVAFLIAIYPFTSEINFKPCRRHDYILAIIAAIYAASFEQVAVLMVGFMVATNVYAYIYKRVNIRNTILLVFSIVLMVFFCVLLPGNRVRYSAEVIAHYPGFEMYTTVDKILMGVNFAISNIERNIMAIILCLAFMVLMAMKKGRPNNDVLLIGMCMVFIYFIFDAICTYGTTKMGGQTRLLRIFSNVEPETVSFVINKKRVLMSIVHYCAFAYLGCCIFAIVPSQNEIIGFLLYFGGIGTIVLMGFSPTLYASGERTCFLGYLMLICTCVRIIAVLLNHYRLSENPQIRIDV